MVSEWCSVRMVLPWYQEIKNRTCTEHAQRHLLRSNLIVDCRFRRSGSVFCDPFAERDSDCKDTTFFSVHQIFLHKNFIFMKLAAPKCHINFTFWRKNDFFCIFFRKYLVMSKKSSTFAGFFAWTALSYARIYNITERENAHESVWKH